MQARWEAAHQVKCHAVWRHEHVESFHKEWVEANPGPTAEARDGGKRCDGSIPVHITLISLVLDSYFISESVAFRQT